MPGALKVQFVSLKASSCCIAAVQGTAAQFDAFKSNVAFIHTYNAAHPTHQVGRSSMQQQLQSSIAAGVSVSCLVARCM